MEIRSLLEIIYGYNLINKDIKTIKRVIHGAILKKTVFLKLIGFLKLSINSCFSLFHNLKFTTFSSSSFFLLLTILSLIL